MLTALYIMLGLDLALGIMLGISALLFKVEGDPLVARIDAILPQTQCGQCGYPGCKPYSEAIAGGDKINKCPPGGEATIKALAELLDVEVLALDAVEGEKPQRVAFIREAECIGCTKCIQACPVDAIVGAAKQMHTVIAELCTGCDLCVPPCPVDCIAMIPVTPGKTGWDAWSQQAANAARRRHDQRTARLQREKADNDARLAAKAAAKMKEVNAEMAVTPEEQAEKERKRAIIAAAMERARLKKAADAGTSS